MKDVLPTTSKEGVRLVRGSHIVVRKLYDHDRCYFFQGADGRIIFAIPYEQDFTLIGTTDADHKGKPGEVRISPEEEAYLLAFANQYFRESIGAQDVVWTYSGVRPLYADGAKSATAATRDYVLSLDNPGNSAPILNIFGGKITTHRRLAEHALDKLAPFFAKIKPAWTARVPLPGGNFPLADKAKLAEDLRQAHPYLTPRHAARLIRAYGTDAFHILGQSTSAEALGQDFGATLTEAEVRWLMTHEFARHASDVVWRRSKLGLRMTATEVAQLETWMQSAKS
jgi:glycerol-3-phosphate dehydrogenase